jgi:hypothetical protein
MIFVIVGVLFIVGAVTLFFISDPALSELEQDEFSPEDKE